MNVHRRFMLLMILALAGLTHCALPAQQFSGLPAAIANLPTTATTAATDSAVVAPPAVDATATFAMLLIETALAAPPMQGGQAVATPTPAPTVPTATPSLLPATPDLAATQTAMAASVATAIAATLTAQPTSTPNLAATQTTMAEQMATSVAATLTAQPQPTATATNRPQPTPPPTATNSASAVVDADGKLNLRAGPDTNFSVLQQLDTGAAITVLGRLATTSWVQIQTATGVIGWVAADYVKSTTPLETYPVVAPPALPVATQSPPTAVPPPAVANCPYPAAAPFAGRWSQAELGCAFGPSQTTWASWTPFEGGHMIWRRDTDTMYIFYHNGQWEAIPDKWDGVAEAPARGAPPAGRQAPIRGAAWVWGNNDAVFQRLGWAVDQQKGFCAEVQTFEQGFFLQSSTVEFCHEERLYNFAREGNFGVLFFKARNAGDWQR